MGLQGVLAGALCCEGSAQKAITISPSGSSRAGSGTTKRLQRQRPMLRSSSAFVKAASWSGHISDPFRNGLSYGTPLPSLCGSVGVCRAGGLRFWRAFVPEEDRQHDQDSRRQEFGLPVLEGLKP